MIESVSFLPDATLRRAATAKQIAEMRGPARPERAEYYPFCGSHRIGRTAQMDEAVFNLKTAFPF